jgi:AraC-like DNA-binding protein
MEYGFKIKTKDPEQMQEHLAPIVGPFRLRPSRGSQFDARVNAKPLRNLGLFTVAANSIAVDIEPPLPFFGINLPLGKSFSITDANRRYQFYNDIHLVAPDRPMQFEVESDCRVLVACLDYAQLRDYANKLNLRHMPLESEMTSRLSANSPSGTTLVRSLARLWAECRRAEGWPGAEIGITEMEDAMMASFVLAATSPINDSDRCDTRPTEQCVIKAEEYLCANLTRPVSRAELATAAGVSIRTLSRGFTARWGTGPMGFLKAKRMDAVYRKLLGAQAGETTVTEVATCYGFNHLGKFALEYKQTFRESPSATLRH